MQALCTALISLTSLRHNFTVVRSLAPQSKVIAVIKANAYGHGMLEAAKVLTDSDAFAVARVEEGQLLRTVTDKPIVVLSGVNGLDALKTCLAANLQPVIHNLADWQLAKQKTKTLCYWLKCDTGMHRLGLTAEEFELIAKRKDPLCQGMVSHFSDSELLAKPKTAQQLAAFDALHDLWPELPASIANSAAIIFHPNSHYDWVRPGIMLYGANPSAINNHITAQLQPVMTLQSQVVALHDIDQGECVGYNGRWQASQRSRIATIAVGYADGYPRHAKDGTPVFIRGKCYPLAGKVSMDLITVDVSGSDVAVGDTVELWGNNLPATTVAEWADTISYSLFTGVTHRVPRIYHH